MAPALAFPQYCCAGLDGLVAGLLGADADGLDHGGDEDLAVADLAGLGGFHDGGDGGIDEGVGDDDFDFDLGQEVHGVFAAAVDLGVAFLPPESFDFADGHSFHADVGEGVFYFFEFEGLDDGFDFFHWVVGDG